MFRPGVELRDVKVGFRRYLRTTPVIPWFHARVNRDVVGNHAACFA